MTAINVLASPKNRTIHIATDAASYDSNGILCAVRSKVHVVPEWSAAITGRGNQHGVDTAVRYLKGCALNFDELIYGVSRDLRKIVETHSLDRPFELIITGFSKHRDRPEIYFIRTEGHDSSGVGLQPFIAFSMGNSLLGPWPSDDLIIASGFIEPQPDDPPKKIAKGLRKLLELQRYTLGDDGASRIGGFVELTTITLEAVDQRVLHRWEEDRPGTRIPLVPILWSKWNREHGF